ncbi:MAG: DUF370 domain-containing protein [Eubacteriales bacterium]|nr:DUF370 domain-containing protein [Eubacteriales bacterium]
MYLHIGEDTVIRDRDIIGIFDMDTSTVNKATRDYLKKAEQEKRVVYVNYDLPKCFVVTDKKVFISPINTSTLSKRAKL